MSEIKAELARLEAMVLLFERRTKALERRAQKAEQAILELDAAFRRSGVAGKRGVDLSLRPADEAIPDRPSADDPSTIPA